MRCSFCHDGLPALWVCPGCRTVLHAACHHEDPVCPTLGCGGVAEHEPPPRRPRLRSVAVGVSWVAAVASLALVAVSVQSVAPRPADQEPVALSPALLDCAAERDVWLSANDPDPWVRQQATLRTVAFVARAARWLARHPYEADHAQGECASCRRVLAILEDLERASREEGC